MEQLFAKRLKKVKKSEIREILKLTEKPDMISFAGGLPAPQLFPVEEMKEVTVRVMEEGGCQALQYSTTEGYLPLRQQIAHRMNKRYGTNIQPDEVLMTNGSQQGLDLTGRIFLDEGDVVLCESPTYLGALQAFTVYNPVFKEVPTDDEGMIIEELEKIIQAHDRIKFIYAIPDFQNPTGRSWSTKRRKEFMELVDKYNIPVIEDNPYGELRFEGENLPSLKSMDQKGLVIFLGTFSKTFCPGLRIGWVIAKPEVLEKYIMTKQGTDLHTSTLSQQQIAYYIEHYDFDKHITKIKESYKKKRDLMIKAIEAHFPKEVTYIKPEGGLFLWMTVPEHMDTKELLLQCIKRNVAFVPGAAFFPNSQVKNTLRINFSNASEDEIERGIVALAQVIKAWL